mmetsp:Transcript_44779/g.113333  ORF Transcript_44779/g.113333 Transcript_44779/m.113333 type:complete len:356 (+) Transcript_44779:229-1296(+)
MRSCCPCTSTRSSPITRFAISFHSRSMKGTCLRKGRKSRLMRYSSRVCPGREGRHTCIWRRCFLQSAARLPRSTCPGLASPMRLSVMQGGSKLISMGYGSHSPLSMSIMRNLTASGTGQPRAKVEVCVKGACARSSRFSTSSPCSTGTSSTSSLCTVCPSGDCPMSGMARKGSISPAHTQIMPSFSDVLSDWMVTPLQNAVLGILVHAPVRSNCQPWYAQLICPSWTLPRLSGHARCAHSSKTHDGAPASSRNSTNEVPNRSNGIIMSAFRLEENSTGNQWSFSSSSRWRELFRKPLFFRASGLPSAESESSGSAGAEVEAAGARSSTGSADMRRSFSASCCSLAISFSLVLTTC